MQCLPSRSIDFVLTDPPYLVRYKSRDGRSIANDVEQDWLLPAFEEVYRLLKPDNFAVSFYGWPKCDVFMDAWRQVGFRIVGHFVFVKSYSSSTGFLAYQHENAFLLAKGNPPKPENPIPDVLPFKYSGNRLHPTQKPVQPLRELIGHLSKPGETVLDPFAGSASTAVAAHLEGREFVAIEKVQEYFDIAQTRLSKTKPRPVERPVKKAAAGR
ncbi:MAG: DNA methylase [Leptolyngbya sp. SIO4C1]|nr:DNA methylase [Leptolyngbya sp. SIO4C1]